MPKRRPAATTGCPWSAGCYRPIESIRPGQVEIAADQIYGAACSKDRDRPPVARAGCPHRARQSPGRGPRRRWPDHCGLADTGERSGCGHRLPVATAGLLASIRVAPAGPVPVGVPPFRWTRTTTGFSLLHASDWEAVIDPRCFDNPVPRLEPSWFAVLTPRPSSPRRVSLVRPGIFGNHARKFTGLRDAPDPLVIFPPTPSLAHVPTR